jgi:ribosomal subunit interface protein
MDNVLIHTKNFKVTSHLENFVYKETEKLFKFNLDVIGFDVYLETVTLNKKDEHNNKVKIVVDVKSKKHLIVQEDSFDMYEAILLAIRAMKREMVALKR